MPDPKLTKNEITQDIEKNLEEEFLKKIKKKNKGYLLKLDYLERERIAQHIYDLYQDSKNKHDTLCDNIDNFDDVYRMKRNTQPGDDENTPNYRSPISTVTLEVIHANVMNVFFGPKDIMRTIPTEEGDIPKIKKLDIFGNWSLENELKIFEACDRLFHASDKNGECPYLIHWVKEYGTEIKIEPVMNPQDPTQPLLDEDTNEVITQEREIPKLLYNGPKLEIFSRKDYILPKNALFGVLPDWEMRRIRINADNARRKELEGRFYDGTFEEIGGWGGSSASIENALKDAEGNEVSLGDTEKMFIEFYGKLRINAIKEDEQGEEQYEELEDEFIAIEELQSKTLCSIRKNKFPLKMRPTGLDLFMPADDGTLKGTGVIEWMDSIQKMYDALQNQYIFGIIQSNSPFGFFSPTGNTRHEPIKAKAGYLYPTSDPKSVNIVQLPPPDISMERMMEIARNWSQLLFGVSDYSAGVESQIDPSAPAKKAEIVLGQGNVRQNLIIKRKNQTLKDIFKRWFLLYQANMPPNKFMRIAGEDRDNPWKFEKIEMTDFALNSIPDFELTGNVLNANKNLEVNKKIAVYDKLLSNPLFSPATTAGLQALHALTKWFMDGLDETGISNFLPSVPGDKTLTPEEENARFLQGDDGDVEERDDDINHIKKHNELILDPSTPEEVRKTVINHNIKHTAQIRQKITIQMTARPPMMPNIGGAPPQMPLGGQGGQGSGTSPIAPAGNVFPGSPGMG